MSETAGRKPAWLKKRLPDAVALQRMEGLLRERHLHTVCESALCPNLGECFGAGVATFLIMGDVCTRDCRFCGVTSGLPAELDTDEPARLADAVVRLGLKHVVVTSVTRDDLPDGGAAHYVATIRAIRRAAPGVTVEVLVPDFAGDRASLEAVLNEAPEVFNHNIETVPRLYPVVRPEAIFQRSMDVLRRAVEHGGSVVKTGWMVGLGETAEEVQALLEAVAGLGVRMVTIGQYLRPSKHQLPVVEYVRLKSSTGTRGMGRPSGCRCNRLLSCVVLFTPGRSSRVWEWSPSPPMTGCERPGLTEVISANRTGVFAVR